MLWCMACYADGRRCVYPVDDRQPHDIISGECWCHPRIENGVIIHKEVVPVEQNEEEEASA